MQPIDPLPNPANTAAPRPNACLAQKEKPAERFDALMGRLLQQPSPGAAEESGALPPRNGSPADRGRRSEVRDSTPTVCAEGPAAPASPAPAASGSSATAGTGASGGTAPAPGQAEDSAETAPAGSAVTAGTGSSSLAPDSGTIALPPGAARLLPTEDSSTGETSAAKAGPQAQPAGQGEVSAEGGSLAAQLAKPAVPGALQEADAPDDAPSETGMDPPSGAETAAKVEATGISSAQQKAHMQKAAEKHDLTAPAEQKLPAPPSGIAGEELPSPVARPLLSASSRENTELSPAPGDSDSGTSSLAQTASTNTGAALGASATTLRSLERAQDLMALHAVRLRDSGADSLQVVIKPGPDLHLSLNLHMRDGNVEMQATLHRGDFDYLNRHWAELQHQLEQRGIRLTTLTCDEQGANGNQAQFRQSGGRQADDQTTQPGAFTEFVLAGALKPAAARTAALRGWESWA